MASPRVVAVAASGGRDSTALLHCTARLAEMAGVRVIALHVHHGLMPEADDWLTLVRQQARRWGAGFDCRRLSGRPAAGESVEAWARRERYHALAEMAKAAGCGLVLLAHHRRDQAETWLLQALRGGGHRGLSAMPKSAQRAGLTWARPWLELPREAVEAYVRRHRLRHVDDGSNADPRFARSRLREQLWPALTGAFPQAEAALAAAATHAQAAAALADEVAAQDLPPLLLPNAALALPAWQQLPPARRANALRHWLAQALKGPVPESLLARLLAELPQRRAGRWPAPQGELRLYRGALQAHRELSSPVEAAPQPRRDGALDLSQPGQYPVPAWGGHLVVTPAQDQGAEPSQLKQLLPRARNGGERFRLAPQALARSLKKQFQARAVPAWARAGPLLYTAQGELLFVPGLGLEATLQAPPGTPQLRLQWVPTGPRQRPV